MYLGCGTEGCSVVHWPAPFSGSEVFGGTSAMVVWYTFLLCVSASLSPSLSRFLSLTLYCRPCLTPTLLVSVLELPSDPQGDYPGLIPLVHAYLEYINADRSTIADVDM